MKKNNVIIFIVFSLLTGCVSSSALNKRAHNNAKAGDYYESIGQSDAAKEEREMARDNLENSYRIGTILFDILFGHSEK
jgi:Tfp pilus assembly protein PilF